MKLILFTLLLFKKESIVSKNDDYYQNIKPYKPVTTTDNINESVVIINNRSVDTDVKQGDDNQKQSIVTNDNYLFIPSTLTGFINTKTDVNDDKKLITYYGDLTLKDEDYICPKCSDRMHINGYKKISIKHLPFGSNGSVVKLDRAQLFCDKCHHSHMQTIEFKAKDHLITIEVYNYIRDLLATGHYTNTEIAEITHVNRNIIKEIDKERLIEKYTINGEGKELIKPEKQARFLAIDEFKLHDGYKYATHIIDLESGHVLWIQKGKKKQVVYDFIIHVGMDFMDKVIAVACDMNSDFEEAFRDKCPHIKIVFDHFHIIKNYNDKVISAIRKDEQARLEKEGKKEEARTLKRSRFILTASVSTLQKKDAEAEQGKVISKGSELFNTDDVVRKGSKEEKYNKILKENELLFTAELIKEKLDYAYTLNNKCEMDKEIDEIIEMCEKTENKHLLWFSKLLKNHYDGIVSHATYQISSGKMEGTNNKIKTLRRQAYGYPDDEYFFLKIMDISRS